MSKVYEHVVATPIGWLGIRTDGLALTVIDILDARPGTAGEPGPVALQVAEALGRYFAGEPAALRGLALAPAGTAFQQRVWASLLRIPAGQHTFRARMAGAGGSRGNIILLHGFAESSATWFTVPPARSPVRRVSKTTKRTPSKRTSPS